MQIQEKCVEAYRRHKHLLNTAKEIGIPWQTVYWHLGRAGEPVTGDKSRYGSETDRLAAKAEAMFKEMVPEAIDMNEKKFQAKHDFDVFSQKVDVKAATLRNAGKRSQHKRWAFSLKVQESTADFIVCFGFGVRDIPEFCLLIPASLVRHY